MQKPEAPQINPVFATFNKLVDDVVLLASGKYTCENFDKEDKSNIPVDAYLIHRDSDKFIKFCTVRKNELVQFDIHLNKFQPRFYEDEGSDEYCFSIYSHRKLATPRKFQQEFSTFLASEKPLIDFIFDTLWPHIDKPVKKIKKRVRNHVEKQYLEKMIRYLIQGDP